MTRSFPEREEPEGEAPRIAVLPDQDGSATAAAHDAGAVVVPLARAEALVWTVPDPARFPAELPDALRWVQLPSAGVESWIRRGVVDRTRTWTAATGAYATPVAEHALLLLLAGVRRLPECVLATTWSKDTLMPTVGTLCGATVAIIGCGSIGRTLIPSLRALGADVLAVNRSGQVVEGALRTIAAAESEHVWSDADHIVLAAPATEETRHLVTAQQLAKMRPHGWLVNVARGSLVDTEALVAALDAGSIGGAALDVTEPEPLPDDHPLWSHSRAIITPHVANPEATLRSGFLRRLADNIQRWKNKQPLVGIIDLDAGY